jgi:phosphoglycolate phosphatase-like HAD superfamily hydrolase
MIPTEPHPALKEYIPKKDYFIGVDSDGCAFDTMEIKHKECFCPNAIKFLGLQTISRYAREAWDFVNLYSKTRGCNRFLGLIYIVDLLRERAEVIARKVDLPDMTPLVEWTKLESRLSNTSLRRYADRAPHPMLDTAFNWSLAVNESINDMVHNIPPFPFVRDSLEAVSKNADVMVVSSAPQELLQREWGDNLLDGYVRLLAGQEMGTKPEQVRCAASGRYEPRNILIIGDAPGDLKAAAQNGALFYPILPGREEASWERFFQEAMDRFFDGSYAGEYQDQLLREFDSCLPDVPPWKM